MDRRAVRHAVLLRELGRSARRWQTTSLRVLLAAAGLGALLLVRLVIGDHVQEWAGGLAGLRLYTWVSWCQLAAVALLAPILAAGGVAEEPETEELITITHVRHHHLVLGQLVSRALVLVAILGGALPALVLAWAHGTIPPLRLAITLGNTLWVALLLGAVAAWARLRGLGRVSAVVVALGFLPAVLVFLPTLIEIAGLRLAIGSVSDLPEQGLSPVLALPTETWTGLAAPLTTAPLLIHLLVASVRRHRRTLYREPLTRPRPRWVVWGLGIALYPLVLLPLALYALQAKAGTLASPPPAWWALWWLDSALALWLGGWLYLDIAAAATRVGPLRWLADRLKGDGDGPRRLMSATVWRNPVAWRELATRYHRGRLAPTAAGVTVQLGAVLGAFLLGVALGVVWGYPQKGVGLLAVSTAGWTLVLWGLFVGLHTAARSGQEESRERTLELLVLTTLPAARIVLGKLSVPAVFGLPALGLGWCLSQAIILLTVLGEVPTRVASRSEIRQLMLHDAAVVGIEAASALAVVAAAWSVLTLLALALSVRLDGRRTAWALTLLLCLPVAVAVLVGPWQLVTAPAPDPGHTPPPLVETVVTTTWIQLAVFAGLASAAATTFAILSARLRRWVASHSG